MEEPLARPRKFYLLCLTIISVGLVGSHRPDALLHPQFFAEDGTIFLQETFNNGWRKALANPVAGYYDTLSRLVAAVAILFPLGAAPMIFNAAAIGIQILPVWFLNTSRFDELIPDGRMRLALSFFYLALPNTFEIDANLTNTLWHWALLACMVIVSSESRRVLWKIFDVLVVALSGLSGPFSLLLLPSAALIWYCNRRVWSLILFGVNVVTAAIQVKVLMSAMGYGSRWPGPLGMGVVSFCRILGGQVFLGALVGQRGYAMIFAQPWWKTGVVVPLVVTLWGLLVMGYVAWKSNPAMRSFMLFCGLTFVAALASPLASRTDPQWPLLAYPASSARYYFLPMLAWVVCLAWLVWPQSRYRILSVMGATALAIMTLVGIPIDWNYPPFVDENYPTYLAQFEQAPPGTDVTIPINPPPWTMVLHKP